ncbi:MAG: flagellar biosynthetic protein FliO [Chlamydiia bacterium]|nr:flagellar biosynthetic protein FliO [Chlamydiia bacterium]
MLFAVDETPIDPFDLSQTEPLPFEGRDFMAEFFHMVVVLSILLAVFILLTWVLKRFMQSRTQHVNDSSAIKILESRPLSTRCALHLIEVDGEEILIAESQNSVTKIK